MLSFFFFFNGVIGQFWCVCRFPSLFLCGALGTRLGVAACCFTALLVVDVEGIWVLPLVMDSLCIKTHWQPES